MNSRQLVLTITDPKRSEFRDDIFSFENLLSPRVIEHLYPHDITADLINSPANGLVSAYPCIRRPYQRRCNLAPSRRGERC